ncbi:DUF1345 domain-containing protein [Phenylobacterium sp.]|uniref:DUF1345 domain-containing protein n=1 Tax=Phenylobacterium sp. TaxID=1871053 RepID=UPI0025D7BDFD|nr:DUF1345 domain-containing protein [Phenylobacterium sp.]MBX3485593.1 DUF1345 domain-containing protein [Phenylobacterium sp.]MCW5758172.1 DUF1345 domain-containing protein [Phenylobacterium sp.]
MSARGGQPRPEARWRLSHRLFTTRPKLAASATLGIAAGVGATLLGHWPAMSVIVGWDSFCLAYLTLVAVLALGQGPDEIRARAAVEDEGQAVILLLIVAALLASLGAVGLELGLAKHQHGQARTWHVAGAVATVAASWLTMQVILAIHYAHEFYTADETGQDAGGLAFPGDEPPDYWDFIHFSIVIGVAAQTADIAITAKRLRRLATWHSLMAFGFNALIVALAINLVAGLF